MKNKYKNKLKQISQQKKSISSPGKSISSGKSSVSGKVSGSSGMSGSSASTISKSSASGGGKLSVSSNLPAVLNTSGAVMPSPSSASHRAKLRDDARKAFTKK